MNKTFIVNISFSKRDDLGNEQDELYPGDVRNALEVQFAEWINLEVNVKEAE